MTFRCTTGPRLPPSSGCVLFVCTHPKRFKPPSAVNLSIVCFPTHPALDPLFPFADHSPAECFNSGDFQPRCLVHNMFLDTRLHQSHLISVSPCPSHSRPSLMTCTSVEAQSRTLSQRLHCQNGVSPKVKHPLHTRAVLDPGVAYGWLDNLLPPPPHMCVCGVPPCSQSSRKTCFEGQSQMCCAPLQPVITNF